MASIAFRKKPGALLMASGEIYQLLVEEVKHQAYHYYQRVAERSEMASEVLKRFQKEKMVSQILEREDHAVSARMALQQVRVTVRNIELVQNKLHFLMDEVSEVIRRRSL